MKKKAKITLSILASLGFLLALPVSSSVALFSNSHIYEDTFLGGMKLKRDRLKSIQGKKIVLIGGSSLPFGIKSELIEKELPSYSVVDFGLYAALGSEAMLDLAAPYLKEGDIAIVSIEQNEQALSSYFSARTMWQAIDNCKDALFDLDEKDRKAMLGDALSFSSEKMPYLTSSTKAEGEGVYRYSSFNEYGDVESEATSSNIMFEGVDSNQMVSFSPEIVEQSFLDEMNEFAKKANEKGASAYYWFAPCNHAAIANNREIDSYYDWLNQSIDFPILGNPHEAIMNSLYFYDTNFHLNNAGKQNNTKRLILDLKAKLQDASKTDIESLPPPKVEIIGGQDGNNADLGFFNIEEGENYCEISSLTEEGKLQESLTIPYSYHEKAIVTFSEETFKENEAIQTIVIQNNIKRIEDYSFSGSSLSRIEIHNDSPSSITCGQKLLEGCQANIYVPWYSLSKYRSSYFWSPYADRIFAFR